MKQSGLVTLVLGADSRHREHVRFVLATVYFYSACAAIGWHAAALGEMPPLSAHIMGVSLIGTWCLFFALVRGGWSKRFRDPSLTLPHALAGIWLNTQAYMLTGPTRGNVLMLLALSLVFMSFRLGPRQIVGVSAFAVMAMGGAMAVLNHHDPLRYPASTQLAHFGLTLSCLITMGLVAKSVSDLRLRLISQRRELRQTLERVQSLATHDMLTGLANRAHMQELLDTEVQRGQRGGAPFCVALLDLDFFKIVNDAHGHRVGDDVLRGFAAAAQTQLRTIDTLARWGGEEFVLLLPQTRLEDALLGLDRLRRHVAEQRLAPAVPDLAVTFSCGLAQWAQGESPDRLVERADQALYAAKHKGRNCCVAAGPVSLAAAQGAAYGEQVA
ncbi:GGDEF domain-containing protein [Aquabacterium sp.]|uniref:GGDEF domain-containing protein n=1 Tax=Aquabacterium sp. TaxID=1872578 RepID=UPI0035B29BB3